MLETKQTTLLDFLTKEPGNQALPKVLRHAKARASETLQNRGLPQRRHEAFQYIPLHKLYAKQLQLAQPSIPTKQEVAQHVLVECRESFVVFVDGVYQPSLSCLESTDAKVFSLSEALSSFESFYQNRLQQLQGEEDPLALANTAGHGEAAFLYIPDQTELSTPLQLLHITTKHSSISQPKQQIVLGKGAKATVVSTVSSQHNGWVNYGLDIVLGEASHLNLQEVACDLLEESWLTGSIRACVNKDAHFSHASVTKGSVCHRTSFDISLAQQGAFGGLSQLAVLDGHAECHNHVVIRHLAPHTNSRQLFKNLLRESTKASFEGKIFVDQVAQKTDAFQLNNNLLLGEKAEAFAKPNLEIFADDVKASHGATTGQLDPESLFYLQTRGIDQASAAQILSQAFAQEMIDAFSVPSVQQIAKNLI